MKNNLLELKKKALILGMLSTGTLAISGCSNTNVTTINPNEINYSTTEEFDIMGGVEKDQVKVFEPGQHYISVRFFEDKKLTQNGGSVSNAINNIPEGYDVYCINPYVNEVINGYDIWFVNNETVEVTSSYNYDYGIYGYYSFGKVVEKTK